MMGRPKKPLALLKLEGTYRKDRHSERQDDPGLIVGAVEAPASLSDPRATAAWNLMLGRFAGTRRLAPEDLPVLEMAFIEYEIFWQARDRLKTISLNDSDLYKRWHSIAKSALQAYVEIVRRFGSGALDRQLLRRTIDNEPKDRRSLAERMTE